MRLYLLILTGILSFASPSQAESFRVAAAADLQQAMPHLVAAFQQVYPQYEPQVTLGSSGVFSSQLRQGAPFQLFMSASSVYVEPLVAAGLTQDEGHIYAYGTLALVSRSPLHAESAQAALAAWQAKTSRPRLALANPRHAPYGQAAQDWLLTQPKGQVLLNSAVLGENAAQAVQFVFSGALEMGVLAWPLVQQRFPEASVWRIPPESHRLLDQRMVLMHSAGDAARAFYHFLQSKEARAIFQAQGFDWVP
ncbi:molybdate ABC transporter substrate-binding protein [Nitrincola tapanii]|uniref:Molybdate ABC transporter substrate-binding protein n=1 Tax=Nitrincola tapanii TaxID=1708751 RepID=A0A5A9VZG9_9GAMM|nr:molybdate ABC transporter substrate-binding protein [Nitrincola tapanii]KAA0873712.1 molybdate ABC transporter substrate-binding protein [Nitrincola tapanii]